MKDADRRSTGVVLAGATGNLGGRIARELRKRGAGVKALVRPGTSSPRLDRLRQEGVELVEVDLGNLDEVTKACVGATCVVSTLNGLRDVIVDRQSVLLQGAVDAGVPRFIPSDFSLDFTRTTPGQNRNLDLRREFQQRLERAPIQATSVLNGAFAELLTGPAPLVLFTLRRVLYWDNPDQLLDFTALDDVAAYTAAAALDPSTPRWLRIAGDQLTARDLAAAASDVTGHRFELLRAGSLRTLSAIIRAFRLVMPAPDSVFPPWQGMQYLRDMFSGQGKLTPIDNARYPDLTWTSARQVLARR